MVKCGGKEFSCHLFCMYNLLGFTGEMWYVAQTQTRHWTGSSLPTDISYLPLTQTVLSCLIIQTLRLQ
jgi:hypothetical protein